VTDNTISRRSFLKLTGLVGGTFILSSCNASAEKEELGFLNRLLGRPLIDLPQNEDAWVYEADELRLDLDKLPEIADLGSAVRTEGAVLADPILVVLGDDGQYYAFENACTHAGRMIDLVAGTMTLECCSVSSSTFDYQGNVLSGPVEGALTNYALVAEDGYLVITLN
jgi:nitrite reductase/ring-hydroxylating ferredoxin subunit